MITIEALSRLERTDGYLMLGADHVSLYEGNTLIKNPRIGSEVEIAVFNELRKSGWVERRGSQHKYVITDYGRSVVHAANQAVTADQIIPFRIRS